MCTVRLVEARSTAPLSATYPSCAQNGRVQKGRQPRRQRARRAPASPVHLPSMEGAADGGRPSPNPPAECRPIHHFSTVMTHQRISQLSAARLITTDILKHRRLRIRGGGYTSPPSRPHQLGLFAPSPTLHFSDRGSGRQREAPYGDDVNALEVRPGGSAILLPPGEFRHRNTSALLAQI
jgi:hypothetical protein